MTIEELKAKKAKLDSQIFKLLTDFHGETNLLIKGITVRTEKIKCGEVLIDVKTQLSIEL